MAPLVKKGGIDFDMTDLDSGGDSLALGISNWNLTLLRQR